MGAGEESEGRPGRRSRRRRLLTLAVLAFALLVPTAALAAFPGTDPDESVRANTPNDPDFDGCEPDNEGGADCTNPFDQEFERFGFAPANTDDTALYNPGALPARQSAQNVAAGRNPLGQVSGYSADRAWKYFGAAGSDLVGDPEVEIAILDTGIRWNRGELRTEVALNGDELPEPQTGGGVPCGADDCNADGRFDVDDYADDPRVAVADGHSEASSILDASDLIAAFSDGADDDDNGFVDDIAGWDFFDDDNDPYDASSYSSAGNHGSGRAQEAGGAGNNGAGGIGVCPDCMIVPIRVWDTFVLDAVNFAQAVLYAADNGIEVVEGAVGGLSNTRYAESVFAYAYEQGTLPVIVSSDLNTANHNYPTNYDQSLHVQGAVADAHGLGENCPQQCIDFFAALPDPVLIPPASPPGNVPVETWFRNSGLTQYGGHAHIVMVGASGSENTGQAAGAAGLIYSYGKLRGVSLRPNEVKQLLTLTAEDVHPLNTQGIGVADPAQEGWDQHFGYGRADLGAALERIANYADSGPADERLPPEALITAPDWFAPLNLELQTEVEVRAQLAARHGPVAAGERFDWELQWAPGIEPCPSEFTTAASGSGLDPIDGAIATLDLAPIRAALDARVAAGPCGNPGPVSGGSTPDPTAPSKGPGDIDPNEPAFTLRLQVNDKDGNLGEDRKVLFAYRDGGLVPGWPRPIGGQRDDSGEANGGGESSHRIWDVDGDNVLEIIEATSSGELHVLDADGSPEPSFNGGAPVTSLDYPNAHPGSPGYAELEIPDTSLRVPAIGDIDGDRVPEIVDSAGEHVHAWEMDGSVVSGFPVRLDPANSRVEDRTSRNHVKRGFVASPALGDLDGDGALEIVIAGLDQHLYGWDGAGSELPGFPVYLRERDPDGAPIPCSEGKECGESINTAAIGDIDGDPGPEIVVATAEVEEGQASLPPTDAEDFQRLFEGLLNDTALGRGAVYAIEPDGSFVEGWPIENSGIVPDILPMVGPGVDHVLGNVDGDPELEVIGALATGFAYAKNGDGSDAVDYDPAPSSGDHEDKSAILNLFENPIVADLDGVPGLEVIKGGLTTGQAANLVIVGQNVPYNHVLQAWNGESGASLPAYPQAVEDYQLLSSPAVADFGPTPGNEVLAGTGLYLIRGLDAAGVEVPGFPKFTGGWNFAVPSIGDADGDGLLEIAAQTREGFAFLWDTDADACGNDEWWTSRHDEWSSGAYGTDSRPPGAPGDLEATERPDGSVRLSWTAPGDDWLCGAAERFEVRLSPVEIDSPSDGSKLEAARASLAAGETEGVNLRPSDLAGNRHAAVLYRDDAGNWGRIATVGLPGLPVSGCDAVVHGGPGPDVLTGTLLGEKIRGRGGADEIRGGGGDDCLAGNEGDDDVRGQGGDDVIKGQQDDDVLRGGADDDRIRGNKGEDRVLGGAGADDLRAGQGRDLVKGGAGGDEINVRGGGIDEVKCGRGRDTVKAGRRDEIAANCETVRIR